MEFMLVKHEVDMLFGEERHEYLVWNPMTGDVQTIIRWFSILTGSTEFITIGDE